MIIIRRIGVSDGARALKDALNAAGIRSILSNRNNFERDGRIILNWGEHQGGGVTYNTRNKWLNSFESVAIARDKLATFQRLRMGGGVNVPQFWTNKDAVEAERGEAIILERHSLTGQSGSGIVVKRQGEALGDAPLYVKYIRKEEEYRVHVFNGQAVAVQQKRRESDAEQDQNQRLIRNRDNGWVFCIQDIAADRKQAISEQAVRACRAIGLDFGAVDIVVGRRDGLAYVLEINSKPGLSSPTVIDGYVNAIRELRDGRQNQGQ